MHPDSLSLVFAALADPTRREILSRLAAGDATVLELAEPFDMSVAAVSKHLKVLEHAGLISRGRDAQRRPCRIEGRQLKDVADWTDRYRRLWEESSERLDEYLAHPQQQKGAKKRSRSPSSQSPAKTA